MFFLFQNLLDGITALSDSALHNPPTIDIDQHWSNLLSLSVTDLDVSCELMFITNVLNLISVCNLDTQTRHVAENALYHNDFRIRSNLNVVSCRTWTLL